MGLRSRAYALASVFLLTASAMASPMANGPTHGMPSTPRLGPASTSLPVNFSYAVKAYSPSDGSWVQWSNGSGSVAGTDNDKVIDASLPTAPANDTRYFIALTANGTTYLGDNESDIYAAKGPSVWAWAAGSELHAGSVEARDNADHAFEYRIVATGTQDVNLTFNYTINASGRETFWQFLYLNETYPFSWRQHTFYRHMDAQACLSNASYDLVGFEVTPLSGHGKIHDSRTVTLPPEAPKCVKTLAHVYGAGVKTRHHFRMQIKLFGRTNVTSARDWFHTQAGTASVHAAESPKFVTNYTGTVGTGLPNTLDNQFTEYRLQTDNPLVVPNMDGRSLYAVTNHTAPWVSNMTGSASVNATEDVKVVANSTAAAPNGDTRYAVEVNVTGSATTTYADRNGDGTVEAGLFQAWMDDVGGNVLFASVVTRPPVAVIDSITPVLTQEGGLIGFVGHGEDPAGGNITNVTWRSHADGVLSHSPSFNTTNLSARSHLISFVVENDRGLLSPATTRVIRVNQGPTAVIAFAAGTGIDANEHRAAALGSPVTFVGYGVDKDGSIGSYRWASSVDGPLSNASSFTIANLSLGDHLISLTVWDNDGAVSEAATLPVTIRRHPVLLIHGYLTTPSIWTKMEHRLQRDGFETFLMDLRRPTDIVGSFNLDIFNANFTPLQDIDFLGVLDDIKLLDVDVPLPLPDYLRPVVAFIANFIPGGFFTENGTEVKIPITEIPLTIKDYFNATIGIVLKLKGFRLDLESFSIKATLYLDVNLDLKVNFAKFSIDPARRSVDFGLVEVDSGPINGRLSLRLTDILSKNPKIGLNLAMGFSLLKLNLANGDLKSYAQDLAAEIEEIKNRTGLQKVDVVAHDMGGLVARWYALVNPQNDMRKLVMLGTPNHGTAVAKYLPMIIKALIDWLTSYIPIVGGIIGQILKSALDYVLGPALPMMIPRSSFLVGLNGNTKDGAPCIAVFSSSACDQLKVGGADLVPFETQHYVIRGKFDGPITLGHVNICIDYVFDVSCFDIPFGRTGDLLVTLESAKLDNVLRDTVNAWHFGLLTKRGVYDKVRDFLYDDPPAVDAESDAPTVLSSIPVLEATEWLPDIEDSVGPNETDVHSFAIPAGTSNFSAAFSAAEGDINVTLKDPVGTVITPASANNVTINYTKDQGFVTYEIQSPTSGGWEARVAGSNGSGGPANYTGVVRHSTDITLAASLENVNFTVGEGVKILGLFRDGASPVVGATVTASIDGPSGQTTNITLFDDGAHGDANASDGTYGNMFTGTMEEGLYHVNVTGSFTKAGAVVTRTSPLSFSMETYPDLTLSPEDITFDPETPRHEDCVVITAEIHNVGAGDAWGTEVQFFDGRPYANGTLLSSTTIGVPAGATASAQTSWCAVEGDHDIFVQVSPYADYRETNYSNNNASRPLTVSGEPPVADAGDDIVTTIGAPVFFDGTATRDEVGIADWFWDIDLSVDGDGDGVLYNDRDLEGPNPVLESGYPSLGIYMARLNVRDLSGKVAGDSVVIHVGEAKDVSPPVADAGPDLIVTVGAEVRLDASGSGDDFGISSYEWDIDNGTDSDGDGIPDNDVDYVGRVVVVPDGYPVAGQYVVNLTVNDAAENGPVNDTVLILAVDQGNVSIPCSLNTKGQALMALADLCELRSLASQRNDTDAVAGIDRAIDRLLASLSKRDVDGVSVDVGTLVTDQEVSTSKSELRFSWEGSAPDEVILRFRNATEDVVIPIEAEDEADDHEDDEGGNDEVHEDEADDGHELRILSPGEVWVPVADKCYRERQLLGVHIDGEDGESMELELEYFKVTRSFEVWIGTSYIASFNFTFEETPLWADENRANETLVGPSAVLQGLIDDLRDAALSSPDSHHDETLEEALHHMAEAVEKLSESPPDLLDAVEGIEKAVDELEEAVEAGVLDSDTGKWFVDDLAGIARHLAAVSLDLAIAEMGDAGLISEAQRALEQGDELRASEAFREAVSRYTEALERAEDASGGHVDSDDLRMGPAGMEVFRKLQAAATHLMNLLAVSCEGYQTLSFDFNWTLNETVDVRVFQGDRLLAEHLNVSSGAFLNVTPLKRSDAETPQWIELRVYEAGDELENDEDAEGDDERHGDRGDDDSDGRAIQINRVDVSCGEFLEADTAFGNFTLAEVFPILKGGLPADEAELASVTLNRLSVQAERLAQSAFAEASTVPVTNVSNLDGVSAGLGAARDALQEAYVAWANGEFNEAIRRFGEAWALAVTAKKLAAG